MLKRSTLSIGLYGGIITLILTLTGIFQTFSQLEVIRGRLTLDVVFLLFIFVAPAYFAARRLWQSDNPMVTAKPQPAPIILNAVVASLIVCAALLLLIGIETLIAHQDFIFVFQNYDALIGGVVTFGYPQADLIIGVLSLVGCSALMGVGVAALLLAPSLFQRALTLGIALTVVFGLLERQLNDVITLADALALVITALGSYFIALQTRTMLPHDHLPIRLLPGLSFGLIMGVILTLAVSSGVVAEGGFLRFDGNVPRILGAFAAPFVPFLLIFGITGVVGALMVDASSSIHNSLGYFTLTIALLGILNTQGGMTDVVALAAFIIFSLGFVGVDHWGKQAQTRYEGDTRQEQRTTNRLASGIALILILIAPMFLGQYITNVLDLVMLYIIMGIGLNIMVGYSGLLNLGYVASFAIGAYTSALLTTPSIITTGCLPVADVERLRYYEMCAGTLAQWDGIGILNFWQSLPLAILVSALVGVALGIPVLRLRGDYLAIVTLGFGEITGVLTRANVAKPLLGAAQGITPIPVPVLDLSFLNPDWVFTFNNASSIYYIYVFGVLLAAFVVNQLLGARIGRAWRALKADEDVAQAMGIHLVNTKLLSFGLSSAIGGMGGAIFAAQLRGIFPDSFVLAVSINVLSLIIIGGLGSTAGVVIGALMLVGLPEVLREVQDYRLLAFGVLLVVVMLLKPEGLLPPSPARLSEQAKAKTEGINHPQGAA